MSNIKWISTELLLTFSLTEILSGFATILKKTLNCKLQWNFIEAHDRWKRNRCWWVAEVVLRGCVCIYIYRHRAVDVVFLWPCIKTLCCICLKHRFMVASSFTLPFYQGIYPSVHSHRQDKEIFLLMVTCKGDSVNAAPCAVSAQLSLPNLQRALHNQGDSMSGAPMNRIRTNWQGKCMFASVFFLINFWRVQTMNKCKFVLRHLPEIWWKETSDFCHKGKGMWRFSVCNSDTHMNTHSFLVNVYLALISASAPLSVRVRGQ